MEIFFCFAGETYDERSTNADVRDACAHAAEKIADVIAGGHAFHRNKHTVGNVLQRDIDVFRDLVALGDGFDQFIAPMRGVGVEESDPEVAGNFIQFAQEAGK